MITNPNKHVHAKDRLYALIEAGQLAPDACHHIGQIENVHASSSGCEDCEKIGGTWLNLRVCLICGHVGCCDDSPNRHATAHHHASGHPVIQSFNPGETWVYCYPDDMILAP